MPELPEVEITKQGMLPLLGHTVQQVTIRVPALRWPIPQHLNTTLAQQRLLRLSRRAKYILAEFDAGTLILHLGMSGRIRLMTQLEPVQKHDHFDIQFQSGMCLRLHDPRRFGAVLWVTGQVDQHPLLRDLGVEPLEEAFNAEYLYQRIRNKTAAIKTSIMENHLVVGVGNIYASESLFHARIAPQTPAHQLTLQQCQCLVKEIKTTLCAALRAGGSSLRDFLSTDGRPGYFQQEYFVYGRSGQPCKICNHPISQIKQGQRSTFYCEHCQYNQFESKLPV